MQVKVTTIIPTFQRAHLLDKAIRSVLDQTMPNLKVAVYDNASNDETGLVCSGFKDPRVIYHRHSENIGSAPNFQYGLERVDTPYFSFLSDDDILLPDFYKTGVEALERYPNAIFFAGASILITPQGKALSNAFSRLKREGLYTPAETPYEFIGKDFVPWTSILFRREVIDQFGLLDLAIKAFDTDFVLRALVRKPIVISKKPCALFLDNPASISSSNKTEFIWPSWQKMIDKICLDETLPFAHRMHIEKQLLIDRNKILFFIGIRALRSKNFDEAEKAGGLLADHCGEKFQGKALMLMSRWCQIPLMHPLFVFLLAVRRTVVHFIKHQQNKKYVPAL